MSWFKENTFLAGLLTLTVALAGVLIFLGMKAGGSLEELQLQVASEENTLSTNKSLNPAPTPANALAKMKSVKEMIAQGNDAREKLLAFRPEKMDDIPAKDFSAKLTDTVNKVKALFPGEKAVPTGFYLGFKKYRGTLPRPESTGELNYQLDAMEYLFTQLSEAGVKQVGNVYRPEIPAENGKDWPDAPGVRRPPARRGPAVRRAPGAPRPPKFPKLPAIAHRMPVEVTFRAPEPMVRDFLTRIGNSDQFFFETRMARVVNPSPLPSAGKGATEEAAAGGAFGGDVVIEGGEPAGDEPVESVKILDKVSGGDELIVYLRADLLLFIAEKTLPELN